MGIGVSTGCVYPKKYLSIVKEIKENGFNLIEIVASREHLDYHNL